jgi:hypothetical protein
LEAKPACFLRLLLSPRQCARSFSSSNPRLYVQSLLSMGDAFLIKYCRRWIVSRYCSRGRCNRPCTTASSSSSSSLTRDRSSDGRFYRKAATMTEHQTDVTSAGRSISPGESQIACS